MTRHNKIEVTAIAVVILGLLLLSLALGCSAASRAAKEPTAAYKLSVYVSPQCQSCPTEIELRRLRAKFPWLIVKVIDVNKHPEYGVNKVPFFVLCGADSAGNAWCRPSRRLSEVTEWLTKLE